MRIYVYTYVPGFSLLDGISFRTIGYLYAIYLSHVQFKMMMSQMGCTWLTSPINDPQSNHPCMAPFIVLFEC